ncbi:potassium-transporting ATPase subunit KdpC [Methylobacillus sp.]|uniref:potassium-transporting ATPase subunit KdpC n=1 Tax=Methylobacillus sp. TaxID=56818 RepID=UPI002FDF6BF6
MKAIVRPALVVFALLTLITGTVYPAIVYGIGKAFFSGKAEGSLIESNDKIVGSRLIGQNFTSPGYFWGRPSATSPYPYNAAASSGSNQGPLNPDLAEAVANRKAALLEFDPNNTLPIPVDLVTASGSGLDPDISPAAAYYQAARVAQARGLKETQILALIKDHTQARQFGVLGEPRVNVLEINMALDRLSVK